MAALMEWRTYGGFDVDADVLLVLKNKEGEPVRAIHSTASTNNRLSFAVTPQSVALPGNKPFKRSH